VAQSILYAGVVQLFRMYILIDWPSVPLWSAAMESWLALSEDRGAVQVE
jgi:hypothetical protein